MKPAALGFRMHSGWGVLVAVSGDADWVEVVDRKRIVVADSTTGANQPYHHAARLRVQESENHIATCEVASDQFASAIERVVRELDARDVRIVGAAVLLASARPPAFSGENSRIPSADSHRGRRILSPQRQARM